MNWKNRSNQIALGVEGEIAIAFDFAIRFGRDNRLDRADLEARNVFVGVVALVGKKGLGLYFRGQRFGLSDVVDLAACQTERERISQSVDDHMDFRGQASARSAYGLIDDWLLARPGAVLMRSDDSGVDHGVLSVGIIRHGLEKTFPNPLYRPTREARVNVLPGAETRRHIAPGNAGPKLPDHSLDKQPIAEFAIAPNMSGTARQQFFNSRELVAAQSMTVHWGAFQRRLPMNQRFADSRIRSAEKIHSRITIVQHCWI